MPEIIQFAAQIDGITKKKDKTLSIKLGSQELGAMESALIFDLCQKEIWVALAETPMSKDDLNIPEVLAEFRNDKTPSQRLRDVLYVYWNANKKQIIDWDSYYRQQVEKIVEAIKDKLD